ncbi:MAG: acylphosphatase [Chloroflexi bacterium]|jgi:acylphosphatase|nr:acylphosphatase [Chloroflexota bacterium]
MSQASGDRLEACVRGRVQGVGFRWFVSRQAVRLSLTGWVANRPDGSVAVVVEGPPERVDELLGLLRQGPPSADVSAVDTERRPATGAFRRFEVRSGHHSGD